MMNDLQVVIEAFNRNLRKGTRNIDPKASDWGRLILVSDYVKKIMGIYEHFCRVFLTCDGRTFLVIEHSCIGKMQEGKGLCFSQTLDLLVNYMFSAREAVIHKDWDAVPKIREIKALGDGDD